MTNLTNHCAPSPVPHQPVLIRAAEAERVPLIGHILLADADATGGALSSHRVELATGANGAVPHHHTASSELFYILDGRLDVLVGTEVHTADPGDLLVVPPHLDHAFAAHPGSAAEALIVITPGIQRFDYFRLVQRTRAGQEPAGTLRASQERFDTYFVDSAAWQAAREAG
ncbi:cupin domain-containing protein [Catenulispora sp. NF23]|uniref:Cupin domain-containing protein n=1 Tax=Catenulispora pinistramenti TaxID=2705254 RepID=A0ABS5KXH4_9ACTN|nr:cupin domain-containing protein [Catenulispora pinistramenti]MBS2535484.1 cupin domain-containing protein [Catenulispora pinistramenti]MBS2550729.1 cupin domain-containing protein [Catenulispora pinistramenti]